MRVGLEGGGLTWISEVISFWDFSTLPSVPTDLSVCTSKTQRSSVSCVCCPVTTTTSFCTDPAASHSARARQGASSAKEANLCGRGVGEGAGPTQGEWGRQAHGKAA